LLRKLIQWTNFLVIMHYAAETPAFRQGMSRVLSVSVVFLAAKRTTFAATFAHGEMILPAMPIMAK
jgi:hypothetical protein